MVEVAGRLFHGRRDLVLLVINPDLVTAEIRREDDVKAVDALVVPRGT